MENRPRRGVSEFNPSRGPLAYRVSRVSRVSRVVCVPAPYGIFDRLPFIFESTYDLDIYLERVSRLTIRCLTSTQATSSKAAKAIRVCFRGDTLSSKHLASHHKCRDKRRNMPVRHPASCGERDFHTCRSRPGATSPTKEHARASSSDGELWGKRFSYLSLASWGNFTYEGTCPCVIQRRGAVGKEIFILVARVLGQLLSWAEASKARRGLGACLPSKIHLRSRSQRWRAFATTSTVSSPRTLPLVMLALSARRAGTSSPLAATHRSRWPTIAVRGLCPCSPAP